MITGFNTNVRHGGRVYHVQTEDSGRRNPHVISHVYHGGTILASEKRQYAELLDSEDLGGAVRRLMEQQHKAMLQRLKQGEFDGAIAERLGAETGPPTEPPSESTATQPEVAASEDARAFGDGLVSEKPLDEMILEYLVDKARGRPGRPQE